MREEPLGIAGTGLTPRGLDESRRADEVGWNKWAEKESLLWLAAQPVVGAARGTSDLRQALVDPVGPLVHRIDSRRHLEAVRCSRSCADERQRAVMPERPLWDGWAWAAQVGDCCDVVVHSLSSIGEMVRSLRMGVEGVVEAEAGVP